MSTKMQKAVYIDKQLDKKIRKYFTDTNNKVSYAGFFIMAANYFFKNSKIKDKA